MQYVLKQKLVSLGVNYTINGEDGSEFEIKGDPMRIFDRFSFQDKSGNEIAQIVLAVERWRGVYEIHRDGRLMAEVRRDLYAFFPRHRFTIEAGGERDLVAIGDFLDLEYRIKRGERELARFTKQWFHLSDTWGIEINKGEQDPIFLLAVAVILARARQRLWSRG